jgi:hypothetical protein
MPRRHSVPGYVPAVDFFRSLGISFELGSKLLTLGVLRADATLNERPIFRADPLTHTKAKASIAEYRKRRKRAVEDLNEVYV